MNAIWVKIIGCWLLFLIYAISLYFYLPFNWCIFGLLLLFGNTKPKTSQLPTRLGYIVCFGFIAFLVLALIDAYYPFPHSIHIAGEIVAVIILWPLLFYGVYLDCKAFRAAGDSHA